MPDPGQEPTGGGPGGRDPSDIFSVRGPRSSAIPTITAIPRTKEEIQRQRMVRTTIAVAIVIAGLLLTWLGIHLQHRGAIDAARLEVEREGRPAAIDAALALLADESGAGDVALAARIHATAVLQGIEGHREAAEALLEGHDPAGEGASDHRIARTYLALAEGDPDVAGQHASALVIGGPRAAEAGHARALAALAIGNVEQALGAAQAASAVMTDAPRHAALLARIAARAGTPAPLEGDAIPTRLARAQIAWDAGDGREQLGEAVRPIADDATATPAERAWARLLVGLSAIDAGDTQDAVAAIARAAESLPPGDEVYRVQLAEAWLALSRRPEAQAIVDALAPGVSADAGRRAQVLAELHLASGRLDEAERVLAQAPAGPRTSLVRGRIADQRGQAAEARALYEEAARSPAERIAATVALASMLVRTEHPQEAVTLVDPLLEERPTHPRVAAIGASAHAAAGNPARGLGIAQTALDAHAREPILLAAKARIHLAASEWQAALDALRIATEVNPTDPQLQTERGRAAGALEQVDEARTAYEAAIALDPRHAEALRSLLAIQLDTNDLDGARATLERIDAADTADLEVERMRARYFVATLSGAAGLSDVRRALRANRRDEALAYSLARLHMQAERFYDALEQFQIAMPDEGDAARRDITLWRLLAFARARRAPTVEQQAEQLREAAREAPLAPQEEARLLVAEAWVQWHDDAYGRVSMLGRRALQLDPGNAEALHILATVDEIQHRDPTRRLEAAIAATPPSVEAYGRLALTGETMDAERCAWGRRYLRAAPEGGIASAVRERVRTCPRE